MDVTKRQLLQCTWGELKEADNLQSLQQAILVVHPPPTTTVTQYTTHLISAIYMDSTVWRHSNIHIACQDHELPHPLFNPITIFNIHNNNHFTTLITNIHTYYLYDSIKLRPPPATNIIHNILRQWYTG